ncbi:hypothetical protein HanHA300_Chr17g0645091 [Helianthus annuus]|nr:hypothetical protein HanHA300_Chr17g0645091 [Helianthus annuus]KAJ0432409.1 hypothetical protein HanIR_Chr17g0858871 [Helianthus annuus]KAJ0446669.1 hypothetical protein HanHA89_Chr17g0696781 [Helianthus annuus]
MKYFKQHIEGLGSFDAALESPKSWVMNVMLTIAILRHAWCHLCMRLEWNLS